MTSVKIIDNAKKFGNLAVRLLDSALGRMSIDVVNIAKIRVPFKSSDLQDSMKAERLARLHHRVVVRKEYAAYQERGRRKDGSHRVRKYTTPGTGKGYLKGAGTVVTQNALNYYKQAAQLAKI